MNAVESHWLDDEALRAAYEFLIRAAFHDCVLPDVVTLRLRRKKGCDGFHYPHQDKIDICPDQTPYAVLRTLAHEIVHMVLEKQGDAELKDHDANFKALAKIVCRRMGWPLKGF
jgi:Zn-dependent peptidase ImmA (M78 family)